MKKKIIIVTICIVLAISIFCCWFWLYRPYHNFDENFIIGSSKNEILDRYGLPHSMSVTPEGNTTIRYKIRENTPEFILSYDNSLWYMIYLENDKAVRTELIEGNFGG